MMTISKKTATVGVVGLGLLGRGIAACLLAHGLKVIAYTRRESTHAEARDYIKQAIDDLISQAGCDSMLRERWPQQYTAVRSIEDFAPCDFVIESIIEDLGEKRQVFDQLESVLRTDVPIASNTSSLPISTLQCDRRHPERFVGMHWAEPSHATRFLELIRGNQTSEAIFQQVKELAERLGKEPSLVQKDIPAFIVNRIGYAMYREAAYILEMGVADVETIDRSFRNACGLWATICGPFRWMDLTGGPAVYARAIERVLPSLCSETNLSAVFKKVLDEDLRGIVDGRGFYSYSKEEAQEWEELLRRHTWKVRELLNEYFPLAQALKEKQ